MQAAGNGINSLLTATAAAHFNCLMGSVYQQLSNQGWQILAVNAMFSNAFPSVKTPPQACTQALTRILPAFGQHRRAACAAAAAAAAADSEAGTAAT